MVIFNLKKTVIVFFLFLLFSSKSYSTIEVIGKVYEIEEISLLESILNTLKEKEANGEIQKMQSEMKKRSIENIENPKGIFLPNVDADSLRFFDPSITLNKAVTLEDGTIIHSAGTVINPLSIRPFTKRLIFIDGDDELQVKFAVKELKNSGYRDKIILVNGSFGDLTRKHQVKFYFDQQMKVGPEGRITLVNEFGIKRLPSIVYQKSINELFLTIKEVKL